MDKTYQIIVLGPGGVGKTKGTNALISILHKIGFKTSEVKPWNEDMVTTSNYVIHNFIVPEKYFDDDQGSFQVALYDMGGQFKYKEMWKEYAEDTDAIVVVVDMTRRTTLHQIALMLPKGIMGDVPVRLIVNKADLYQDFATSIPKIVTEIKEIMETIIEQGLINYSVTYRGDDPFVFNSQVYTYGDLITVLREIQIDSLGNPQIRFADFEAMVTHAFRYSIPNLNEHNANLFGREFTLQAFDKIYQKMQNEVTLLSDDLIEQAHNEAPPFLSFGSDPDTLIPLNALTDDIIQSAVESMLIEDDDLLKMVTKLKDNGYNINLENEDGWAMTSAMIYEEIPDLPYVPMNKAVLPPFFIKKMLDYNLEKEKKLSLEEDYFV